MEEEGFLSFVLKDYGLNERYVIGNEDDLDVSNFFERWVCFNVIVFFWK